MKPSHVFETASSIAMQVLTEFGEHPENIEFLTQGSTSTVFRLVTGQKIYILRIATPQQGKSVSYASDFAIRSALWQANQPVARPIATDQSIKTNNNVHWALDEFCQGAHPVRAKIAPAVSRQLGGLLRRLHELPATGYGQIRAFSECFKGRSSEPDKGMLARFESPWPFGNAPLSEHPAVQMHPFLLDFLQALEPQLISFVRDGHISAVIHTDLHERQFLQHDNRLTAVLDFNDAIIGRCEWDFGSYLYFHGDTCLSNLLDGYTKRTEEKHLLTRQAQLAGILIALHHGNRGVVLQRSHRVDAAARFLENRFNQAR